MGRKRTRLPRMTPPPQRSQRIYLRLPRADLVRLKFHLEACDNLCYVSVLDRWEAVAAVIFSPHQREETLAVLDGLARVLPLERIHVPLAAAEHGG